MKRSQRSGTSNAKSRFPLAAGDDPDAKRLHAQIIADDLGIYQA